MVELNGPLGQIDVSTDVIATMAGIAAHDCYGLVGMASQHQLKDGIAELLRRDNLKKGVEVTSVDGDLSIDIYIIVSYGIKISEVACNVQSKVKYTLDQMLGLKISRVNIYVQGVRTMGGEE